MDRDVFRRHFIEAAAAARDFAGEYLEESLPDAMRFRVHLNASYDATASSDFKLFPEDSSDGRTCDGAGSRGRDAAATGSRQRQRVDDRSAAQGGS